MPLQRALSALGYVCTFFMCVHSPGQATFHANQVTSYINEQAVLSRAGDATARQKLAHQLFNNVAIPSEAADAFGFTDRIASAELAFQNGSLAGIHEAEIAKAINTLSITLGAPQWAQTNVTEVRKLHMRLLTLYPQLLGNQAPPDSKGVYAAINDTLSPMEASYLALTMLFQKRTNSDYQLTELEHGKNSSAAISNTSEVTIERKAMLEQLLQGKASSTSVRDLLMASDHFFDDLGIRSVKVVGSVHNGSISRTGGR